jgi:hypothetical protein
MTFQVALIGSDGLVVGSDRKITNRATRAGDAIPYAQSEERTKFFKSADESVICTFIGSAEAQNIAGKIVEGSDPTLNENSWQDYLHEMAQSCSPRTSDELLVVRKGHITEVVRIVLGSGASRIESHFCGGAIVPACFLTEHFWTKRPVSVLRKLALLTLDFGAREAPSVVGGGFDLLILTENGTKWENYGPNHERVLSLRAAFDTAVNSVLELSVQEKAESIIASISHIPPAQGSPQLKDYATWEEFRDAGAAFLRGAPASPAIRSKDGDG